MPDAHPPAAPACNSSSVVKRHKARAGQFILAGRFAVKLNPNHHSRNEVPCLNLIVAPRNCDNVAGAKNQLTGGLREPQYAVTTSSLAFGSSLVQANIVNAESSIGGLDQSGQRRRLCRVMEVPLKLLRDHLNLKGSRGSFY